MCIVSHNSEAMVWRFKLPVGDSCLENFGYDCPSVGLGKWASLHYNLYHFSVFYSKVWLGSVDDFAQWSCQPQCTLLIPYSAFILFVSCLSLCRCLLFPPGMQNAAIQIIYKQQGSMIVQCQTPSCWLLFCLCYELLSYYGFSPWQKIQSCFNMARSRGMRSHHTPN